MGVCVCVCFASCRVVQITTMYEEYFPPDGVRPLTDVPYYEGDYWHGIAEDFIAKAKESEANGGGKTDGDGDVQMGAANGKSKKSKTRKSKTKSKRTKSKRRASTKTPKKSKARKKPLGRQPGDPGYDEVYEDVAKILKTMKADFMVAKLRPTCGVCLKYVPAGVGGLRDVRLRLSTLSPALGDAAVLFRVLRAARSPLSAYRSRVSQVHRWRRAMALQFVRQFRQPL